MTHAAYQHIRRSLRTGRLSRHAESARRCRIISAVACVFLLLTAPVWAGEVRTGTASWYSRASVAKEGNPTGVMANGKQLNDQAFTAASWDWPLGTRLTVCAQTQPRVQSGHEESCVHLTVCDRGPSKRLYRHGRIIDLSQAAFTALAPLEVGVIPVTVTAGP